MPSRRSTEPEAARDDLAELRDARNGVHEAGRALMRTHGSSMIKTAWRVLGRYGGNEAEDVVQEAFIAALTTPALPHGDVGAWLRSITARKALDWLRQLGRRGEQALPEPDAADEPAMPGSVDAPADVLTVREMLGTLPALDRAILTLVDLEGFSMKEAAAGLGMTRMAVKLRASRARRKLRGRLDASVPSAKTGPVLRRPTR